MLGIGRFGIVKLGCGWCCGDFHEKNWVGLGVSNLRKIGLGLGWGEFSTFLGIGVGLGWLF